MINIAIIGIFGRMGQEISSAIFKDNNFNLSAGFCRQEHLSNNSDSLTFYLIILMKLLPDQMLLLIFLILN